MNAEYPSPLRQGSPISFPFETTVYAHNDAAQQYSLEAVEVRMILSEEEQDRRTFEDVDWGETLSTEFSFVYPQSREANIQYMVIPQFTNGTEAAAATRYDEVMAESEGLFS